MTPKLSHQPEQTYQQYVLKPEEKLARKAVQKQIGAVQKKKKLKKEILKQFNRDNKLASLTSKMEGNNVETMDHQDQTTNSNDNGDTVTPDINNLNSVKSKVRLFKNIKYKPSDKGPFVVFLEQENINPINVVNVGKLLRKLNIY